MVHAPLDMKYVYKRERLLERRNSLMEMETQFPDLTKKYDRNFYKLQIEAFLNSCVSYHDVVNLLESLYEKNDFELLETATKKTINEIIPMVPSDKFDDCINTINSSNIGNVNKDKLIETVKLYKRVDRIVNNHKNLTKRFDLSLLNRKSDKDRCFTICEMVDTYNIPKYIKFNIVLEEMSYLGYINGNRIPDEKLVENVLNYFLLIENNSTEDIESYKKAIDTSKVISENATANISYFYKNPASSSYWKDQLVNWKLSSEKNIDTIIELAQENYSNFIALDSILSVIKEFCQINSITFNPVKVFSKADSSLNIKEIKNIINIMEDSHVKKSHPDMNKLESIWQNKINDESYSKAPTKFQPLISDEIDTFKMRNLMNDAKEAEKFLNQVEKTSMKEAACNIKRIVNYPVDINESNKIDYVDEYEYMSIPIRSYSYEGTVESVVDLLDSTVKCLNNILYKNDSSAYYNLFENQFDIFLKSKYKVILSEAQELSRGLSPSDKFNFVNICNNTESLERLYNSQLPEVASKLLNKTLAATINVNEASLLYEMMSPICGTIYDENCIFNDFMQYCRTEANPQFDKIKKTLLDAKTEAFSYENNVDRVNACLNFLNILEENEPEKKSEDEDNFIINGEESEPNTASAPAPTASASPAQVAQSEEKRKLSLNNIKLAWEGLKSKFKKASAKEQEFSRNLDLEFNHLLKLVNRSAESDAKKEAITGEVNRSLSKTIKMAIGLAGAGLLTGTALTPILGAIGLYARSKYLSRKEKLKIIDTCDIELKVLEREIDEAKQEGSSAKYRQLLTIQKNLQRKRQEIYLGLAVKGVPLPVDSTVGQNKEE